MLPDVRLVDAKLMLCYLFVGMTPDGLVSIAEDYRISSHNT
jgi:hypothetical protein